jgi:hypothetical protein|tara:strand:- start:1974 stop:2546 length:573 start_codon:yes stop_codon:yes gene_type:complete
MRKRTFPICRATFNKLDFEKVDESTFLQTGSSKQYRVESSGGLLGSLVVNQSNEVAVASFVVDEGGEYLVDEDISAPSETTLDWGGDANGIQINLYESIAVKLQLPNTFKGVRSDDFKRLLPGEIFCVGVKPPLNSAFNPNVLPGLFNHEAEYPLGMTSSEVHKVTSRASWKTVMWTGTRWVILGSSNWF